MGRRPGKGASDRRLGVPAAPAITFSRDLDLLDGFPVLRVDPLLHRFAHGEQARLVGDRGRSAPNVSLGAQGPRSIATCKQKPITSPSP